MSVIEVRSGDVRLLAKTWGARKGRSTLVLVHGYPDTHAVWDSIAELLAVNHYVVAYDVRGAGASTRPVSDREFSLAHLTADLAAVIDATCDSPVHLVGHDWGSIQAWESVTDASALGGRLRSFTSISGPCLDHVGHWLREQSAMTVAAQAMKSWYVGMFQMPGAKLAWRAFGHAWPRMITCLEDVDATPGDRARDGAHGVALYRANVARHLIHPRPRLTTLPVQLIVPVHDRYVDPRLLAGVERWAPNVWRRDVNAGHWGILQDSARVARWLAEWITSIDNDTPTRGLRRVRGAGPFAGKLAVVTGAGSGIGRATTIELVERGADVIAVDLDAATMRVTAGLAALVARDRALGHEVVRTRILDVSSSSAFAELAAEIARTDGCPDVVINNAGIAVAGSFLATTSAEWDRVLAVNLGGVVHGSRLFAQQMIDERRPGHIINVASAAAFAPSRALSAYATSKAAVAMLTECLRAELGDRGIRVGGIYPGFVDTPITTATRFAGADDTGESARRRATARLYRRRGLTADHVAREICDAIEHDRPMSLVGAEAVGLSWLARFAPAVQRRLARVDLSGAP